MFTISNLPRLLLIILSCSIKEVHSNQESFVQVLKHFDIIVLQFHHISQLFQGCHLQFLFFEGTGNIFSPFTNDILSHFGEIVKAIENHVILSTHKFTFPVLHEDHIHHYQFYKHKRVNSISKQWCTIHIYVYEEVEGDFGCLYCDLVKPVVTNFAGFDVWPNHFIFLVKLMSTSEFGDNEKELLLYRHSLELKDLHIRGITFVIHHTGQPHVLCIPCFPHPHLIHYPVNVSQNATNVRTLYKLSKLLNSNLRGESLSGFSVEELSPEPMCQPRLLHDAKFLFRYYPPLMSHCAHYLLKHKLNYTLVAGQDEIFVSASGQYPLSANNFNLFSQDGSMTWIENLANFDPLTFIAYQETPRLNAKILYKAYSWETWLMFAISAVAIAILTVGVEDIQSWDFDLGPIAIDVLSSILDQPVKRNSQKIVNNKAISVLPAWFKLWMLMIVVLGNGYKGMVYSFITNGIRPIWPPTLHELLRGREFLIITTNRRTTHDTEEVSSLIKSQLSAQEISSYPASFRQLNATLQMLRRFELILHKDLMAQNKVYESLEFSLRVNRKRSRKFALVNFNDWYIEHVYLVSMYGKWMVSSEPRLIEGIELIKFWIATRNFFADYFSHGLAQLEQLGFSKVFHELIVKRHLCHDLPNWLSLKKAKGKFTALHKSDSIRRCGYLVKYGASMDEIENDPKTLSLRELKHIFYIILACFCFPTAAYFLEASCFYLLPAGLKYWKDFCGKVLQIIKDYLITSTFILHWRILALAKRCTKKSKKIILFKKVLKF